MKNTLNTAFVVSVHYGATNDLARINVKWKGNHEISDFNFDRVGEVLSSETETENTGWVIVRSSYRMNNSSLTSFSQSGPPILRFSDLVGPGDEIPCFKKSHM
jgi:hypothetical protein